MKTLREMTLNFREVIMIITIVAFTSQAAAIHFWPPDLVPHGPEIDDDSTIKKPSDPL